MFHLIQRTNCKGVFSHNLEKCFVIFLLIAFIFTNAIFVPGAQAVDETVLGVTQIKAVQTYATADGTFENGWSWIFDVTVPSNETLLKMKFDDWTNGQNIIDAAENVRFYSAQSSNATDAEHAIVISMAKEYGEEEMALIPNSDLDAVKAGRQVQIVVETAIPIGSSGGSYSTSYGIQTYADPNTPEPEEPSTEASVTFSEISRNINSETGAHRSVFGINVANMIGVSDDVDVRYKITILKDGQARADQGLNYVSSDAFATYQSGSLITDMNGTAYIDPVYGQLLNLGSMNSLKSFGGLTTNFTVEPALPAGNYTVNFSVVRVNGDGTYSPLTPVYTKIHVVLNVNGALTVALAGTPSSGVAIKSQSLIPAAGFVFSAGVESDVTIKTLTLTGYGATSTFDLNGAADDVEYFNTVVSSCSLYDGDVLLNNKSPVTGVLNFIGLEVDVFAGASKTLTVKCDMNAITTTSFFSIGITSASSQVIAEDEDGDSIIVTGGLNADGYNSGSGIYQTVYANGTLTIAAGNQPSAAIVLGGTSAQLAQVKATAQYEDIRLDRVRVYANTVAKNVTSVSLLRAGTILGSGVISGSNTYVDITIPGGTVVTKGSTVNFDVYETFANVESGGIGGVDTGATSTGGLYYNVQTTPWTSSYALKYNVEAVGIASGARLYATAAANITGNQMVIRKGKPVITKLASSANVLSTGSPADLYKFQINADADGGDISWIQLAFTVSTSSVATLTSLTNFAFYKGSSQLTANTDVFITDGNGHDLSSTTSLQATSTAGRTVIVRLAVEDTVSSGGTTYTLRATPTLGTTAGGTVTTSFTRDTTTSDSGYLTMAAGDTDKRMGVSKTTTTAQDIVANGTFLWSDMSDVPHSYATGPAVGVNTVVSNDWTWDVLLSGMNDVNTLSN